MLYTIENIALRIWQILYLYSFLTDSTKLQEICQLRKTIFSIVNNILQENFAILLSLGCSFNMC